MCNICSESSLSQRLGEYVAKSVQSLCRICSRVSGRVCGRVNLRLAECAAESLRVCGKSVQSLCRVSAKNERETER